MRKEVVEEEGEGQGQGEGQDQEGEAESEVEGEEEGEGEGEGEGDAMSREGDGGIYCGKCDGWSNGHGYGWHKGGGWDRKCSSAGKSLEECCLEALKSC